LWGLPVLPELLETQARTEAVRLLPEEVFRSQLLVVVVVVAQTSMVGQAVRGVGQEETAP